MDAAAVEAKTPGPFHVEIAVNDRKRKPLNLARANAGAEFPFD